MTTKLTNAERKKKALYKRLKQKFRNGEYWSVIDEANHAIKKDNHNHILHFRLATSYHQLASENFNIDYYHNAINAYDQAIKFAPRIAQYYAKRADCYLLQNSMRSQQFALVDYSLAYELAPHNNDYARERESLILKLNKTHSAQDIETLTQKHTPIGVSLPMSQNYLNYVNVNLGSTHNDVKNKESSVLPIKQSAPATNDPIDKNSIEKFGSLIQRLVGNTPSQKTEQAPSTDPANRIDQQITAKKQALRALKNNYKKERRECFGWALAAAVSGIVAVAGAVIGALVTPIALVTTAILTPICYLSTLKALENSQKRQRIAKKIKAKENDLLKLKHLKLGEDQESNPSPNPSVPENDAKWEKQRSVSSLKESLNLNHLLRHRPANLPAKKETQKIGDAEVDYSMHASHP